MKADAQLTLFAEAFLNLASLSPLPGSSEAKRMTVTSGRRCSELYPKSDPLGLLVKMCLESSIWHSTMCYLTWKASATPAKRLIFQLAPSMPRTKGKGCGLWPTPQTRDYRSGDEPDSIRAQRKQEQGWSQNLNDSVKMWATPNAADSVGSHGGGQGRSLRTDIYEIKHGMWSTPAANDGKNGTLPASQIGRDTLVGDVMKASMWPTPRANKPEGYSSAEFRPTLAQVATGEEKPIHGQLNPDWVDTMMGFPAGWSEPDCDNPQEMPFPAPMGCEQYEWEPPRVTANCPNRANRLKADGNAVVPQIPEIFGRLIIAVEGGVNP